MFDNIVNLIAKSFISAVNFIEKYLLIILFLAGMAIGFCSTKFYYSSKENLRLFEEAKLTKQIQVDVMNDKIKSNINAITNENKLKEQKEAIQKQDIKIEGDCAILCKKVNEIINK